MQNTKIVREPKSISLPQNTHKAKKAASADKAIDAHAKAKSVVLPQKTLVPQVFARTQNQGQPRSEEQNQNVKSEISCTAMGVAGDMYQELRDIDDIDDIFRGNQWAFINDPYSWQGIEAKEQRVADAPPLPHYLIKRVQAEASLVLTQDLQHITIESAIERFKDVALGVYEEILEFFELNFNDEFGVLNFEVPTVREIISILMCSEVGYDFYIPCSQFLPWEYQQYGIVRLAGNSSQEL